MKSRDTLPDSRSEASRNATNPGIAPRADRDEEVTEPGFRPDSVREVPELRAILVDDGLDELAAAAKATCAMPERPDSDGARNARYATEGRPARAANVTMPTGDVVLEPTEASPSSKPPEEVVGLMRDPIREGESAEPSADEPRGVREMREMREMREVREVREVPSERVDMGMAVETVMPSRRDIVTSPSARLIEQREGRSRVAALLAGIGVTVICGVVGFGMALREPRARTGANGNAPTPTVPPAPTAPTGATASPPPGSPKVVAPVAPGPHETSPNATASQGPRHATTHGASPLKSSKPEVPSVPVRTAPPAPKASIAPPVPTDITHNFN